MYTAGRQQQYTFGKGRQSVCRRGGGYKARVYPRPLRRVPNRKKNEVISLRAVPARSTCLLMVENKSSQLLKGLFLKRHSGQKNVRLKLNTFKDFKGRFFFFKSRDPSLFVLNRLLVQGRKQSSHMTDRKVYLLPRLTTRRYSSDSAFPRCAARAFQSNAKTADTYQSPKLACLVWPGPIHAALYPWIGVKGDGS